MTGERCVSGADEKSDLGAGEDDRIGALAPQVAHHFDVRRPGPVPNDALGDLVEDDAVDCCRQAGFTPTIRHTTDDYVVVQNLVARGLGVTVLPDAALSAYRHPDVRVVPMPSLGRRHVGVAHRAGAETVPATAALLEQVALAAQRS